MNCISCGAKTELGTTSDVTDLKKCLIIVRNTPCYKCTECTEVIYTGDVLLRLEKIIEKLRLSIAEIAVFDYTADAA